MTAPAGTMKIFAANWKLHKNPKETREFFAEFTKQVSIPNGREIVFFPSTVCLEAASQSLVNSKIKWGAQNSYFEAKGAFTGETSAQTVKDLGGSYILLGHSERRAIFSETDELIAKKVAFVQSLGLTAMLCIGETLAQREAGKTLAVLEEQLRIGLSKADQMKPLVIAYEPVWAIGTGKIATSEQVAEAHAGVYSMIQKMGFSAMMPILYGGSVKPENSKELLAIKHVDGFLVGGASLEVASFKAICQN
jgi:triosephosphate isomerase